jgi:hypothetical protein
MTSTNGCFRHSKAAGGGTGSFAFVPHTLRFLGRQSLGVEPAVKVMLVSRYFTFRPRASVPGKRGTANPTEKDYRSHDGFFAAQRVRTWGKVIVFAPGEKKAPTLTVGAKFLPNGSIRGTCSYYAAQCRRK